MFKAGVACHITLGSFKADFLRYPQIKRITWEAIRSLPINQGISLCYHYIPLKDLQL
jgi:hypothetical protein